MGIKQNNKLIAEFIYPKFTHPRIKGKGWKNTPIDISMTNGNYRDFAYLLQEEYEDLNYHSSWNNLMPVIKRIHDDGVANKTGYDLELNIYKTLEEVEIKLTYNAVVEFVKWYNKNK